MRFAPVIDVLAVVGCSSLPRWFYKLAHQREQSCIDRVDKNEHDVKSLQLFYTQPFSDFDAVNISTYLTVILFKFKFSTTLQIVLF